MKARWRMAACLLLCGVLVWFLADAGQVRQDVSAALALCARSVIPALFPFLAVSTLLLQLGFGELAAPWLAGLMEPLFRVDGAGSSALLLGLVGGYPIGPRTTAELYRQGSLRKDEAERLLTFSNNSNPVFLISVLGIGVFGSVRVGIWLWLIHVLSALLTGLCFRRYRASSSAPQAPTRGSAFHAVSFSAALVESVRAACSGILSVCAFVLFFYVLARPLSALPPPLGPVLVGVTELFSLTPLLTADRFGFVLSAAASGWGGLSVLCQTAAVLEGSGLSPRSCVLGKAVQGLFSLLLALLLSSYVLS